MSNNVYMSPTNIDISTIPITTECLECDTKLSQIQITHVRLYLCYRVDILCNTNNFVTYKEVYKYVCILTSVFLCLPAGLLRLGGSICFTSTMMTISKLNYTLHLQSYTLQNEL